MSYKCVHCSKLYDDGSEEVLKGCSGCGGRFFFYIKKEQLDKMKEMQQRGAAEIELAPEEKQQMEDDLREIAGFENEETPVFLDFESIKVIREGKYLVDLANLFSTEKPRVYKLEDGKYIIDLTSKAKAEKE